MTCKCKNRAEYVYRQCDVCKLVFGDYSYKYVRYCSMCDAYICDECSNKWHWRAIAAMKRAILRSR